jgi:8-oxo-dGTP diphosphatase
MTNYVAGLMFDPLKRDVALVEKRKFPPGADWTANPWNAIGGKIEPDEFSYEAMIREFKEETGVTHLWWEKFLILENVLWRVEFYKAFSSKVYDVKTIEEEQIGVAPVENALKVCVPNLKWIVPLAIDPDVQGVCIVKSK